jgi:hypothetical protein
MRNVFFKICQGHIRKRGVLKHEQCLKKEGIDAFASKIITAPLNLIGSYKMIDDLQ